MLTDGAHRDRRTGLTVGRVDADIARFACRRVLKEAVETAAADHSEHAPIVVHAPGLIACAWQAEDALMATFAQWMSGARPRTLPNAVAPVIAGTGAAAWLHSAVWWKALLALAVALALIIGVNYANDYSDGIRGTDDSEGRSAATGGFATGDPTIGVDRSADKPDSRGGGRPGACVVQRAVADHGRRRLHCRSVAVHGRVQTLRLCGFRRARRVRVLSARSPCSAPSTPRRCAWTGWGWCWRCRRGRCRRRCWWPTTCGTSPPTRSRDKFTLAVRLGDARTRVLYQALLATAGRPDPGADGWRRRGVPWDWWPRRWRCAPRAPVRSGRVGPELIPVLRDTGLAMLVWAIAVAAALTLARWRR